MWVASSYNNMQDHSQIWLREKEGHKILPRVNLYLKQLAVLYRIKFQHYQYESQTISCKETSHHNKQEDD